MADIQRTVEVIFEGTDKVSSTMTSISSRIDTFAGDIGAAAKPFADMADTVLKLEAALGALAVGGMALAINAAGNFNDQFNEITTLFDATGSSVGNFEKDITAYAQSSVFSISDINKSIYDAISAGVKYEEALGAVSAAEKLGVATKATLNDSINLLVPTLNAFGKGMGDAENFADILFQTVKTGKTTLTELAGPLAQVTGIAATAGVPFDQLAAAIAGLTSYGVRTSEAITGIKAALSNIIKPSSEAQEVSRSLGLSFNAQSLAADGLQGFLQKVYDATGGNITTMGKLFGSVEGLNAVMLLAKDESGKFATALEAMATRAGSVGIAFDKMSANFGLANQNVINNLQVLLIEAGGQILDKYSDIAKSVSEVFQGITLGIDQGAFNDVFNLINEFGAELAKDLSTIAKNIPAALQNVDFKPFTESIKGLGDELKSLFVDFFGEIDITTPEGLAAAFQKIVDTGKSLTDVTKGILETFGPMVKGFGEFVDKVNSSDTATKEAAGNILGLAKNIVFVTENVGALTGAINLLAYALGAGSLLKTITTLATALGSAGAVGAGTLVGGLSAAGIAAIGFAANWESLFGGGQGIGETIQQVKNEFVPGWNTLVDGFKTAALELDALGKGGAYYWTSLGYANQVVDEARLKQAAYSNELRDTPTLVETKFNFVSGGASTDLAIISDEIDELERKDPTVNIKAVTDDNSFAVAKGLIATITKNENGEEIVTITASPNNASFDAAKAKVAEIPTEKQLEIKLQGDIDIEIARIKTQAETVQTAVEWKAKLDIANVEADMEKFKASADLISESFVNTGETLVGLVDAFVGASSLQSLDIAEWIEDENRRRNEILQLEKDLIQSQIDLTDAKASAIERGQPLITITGEGLEPELEAFMWKILEKIQIRAAEDDAQFLLGVA